MSRSSAQQAVNNFTGGLVTEASSLKFPQNSLSKAMNVTCTIEGDLRARSPYTTLQGQADSSYSDTLLGVKKFYWEEKDRQVLVYTHYESYTFIVIENNELLAKGVFTMPTGFSLTRQEFLSVNFWDEDLFFVVNFFDPVKNTHRSTLTKGVLNLSPKTISFSEFFTAEELLIEGNREPDSSSELSYDLKSGQNVIQNYRFLVLKTETEGYMTAPKTTFKLFWGPENKTVNQQLWTDSFSVFNYPWPGSPIQVSNYSYYVDSNNTVEISDITTYQPDAEGPGDDPETGVRVRISVAGVYRTSIVSEFKQSEGSQPLRYRDFKGVPNRSSERFDLLSPTTQRQGLVNVFSAYNLYNAGWGGADFREMLVSDKDGGSVRESWPSAAAKTKELTKVYPSPADSRFDFLTEEATVKEAIGLYSPFLLTRNKPYMSSARRGSHILGLGYEYATDVETPGLLSYFAPDSILEGSRTYLTQFNNFLEQENTQSYVTASSIIGGRMWHGVEGRDFNILFSQIDFDNKGISGTSVGNFSNCMQVNDPTAELSNIVLATDGGSLSLKGSGKVYSFKEYRQYVLVFCENGVWAISGSGGDSFSPVSHSVTKLSSMGVKSSESCISVDEAVFYLSDTSLNIVSSTDKGVLYSKDVSSDKILGAVEEFLYFYRAGFSKSMCYDKKNKRILIDYSNNPKNSEYIPPAGQAIELFNSSTLVFDTRLESFYFWNSSTLLFSQTNDGYSFKARGGSAPSLAEESSYTKQDLGFVQSGNTVMKVFADTTKKPFEATSTFSWELAKPAGSKMHFYYEGTGHLVDGTEEFKTAPPVCWYQVESEIPYDILGDPTVDKSVRTITIFQELSPKTVVGTGTNLFLPDVSVGWEWEWDSKRSGEASISNNIQYPEHVNYASKQVGISKTKIPGRGKSLSLRFTPAKDSSTGFCILGYGIDFDASSRP